MARSEPVLVSWKRKGLLLEGITPHGRVDLASALDEEGEGASPMELLAVALGGCAAMDVISILQKMRQPLEALEVEVSGEKADEHPKRYLSLEIVYRLRGDLDERRVKRAIELSEDKYCSVQATLRPSVRIHSRFVVER
jgi:putative redox protein